jgi:hypothetical protein
MFWFAKKEPKFDPAVCCPIIVNQTQHSIVVFQDRGVLYNKQVLAPGEAVGMSRSETAGRVVPYWIHAVVGDAQCLPTRSQSVKNLASMAVIPTAFVVGTLVAAGSAGTLAGPSAALGQMASGMVVRGVVIDAAAITAGAVMASRAGVVADMLVKKHPQNFMIKSGKFMPGKRYVVIRGGVDEPLQILTIKERELEKITIAGGGLKKPMDTIRDKIQYYLPEAISKRCLSVKDEKEKEDNSSSNDSNNSSKDDGTECKEQSVVESIIEVEAEDTEKTTETELLPAITF